MKRRVFLQSTAAAVPASAALAAPAGGPAPELQPVVLPKPRMQGGKPLLQALSERKTERNIGEEKVPLPVLSTLLWAAFGVNRPATGMRTAPAAMAVRDIDIYVFLPEGVYVFDAVAHSLKPLQAGDHRTKIGGGGGPRPPAPAGAGAKAGPPPPQRGLRADPAKIPVNFVYVADFSKYPDTSGGRGGPGPELQNFFSSAHVGFIAQNVYLFAASEGLGAWFRAGFDGPGLAKLLALKPSQKVMYTQSVGYPKKA